MKCDIRCHHSAHSSEPDTWHIEGTQQIYAKIINHIFISYIATVTLNQKQYENEWNEV